MKRRTVIAGVAAAGAAAAAGVYRFTDVFVKHYPPTPYDDVLASVVDREEAAKLGKVLVVHLPHSGYPGLTADKVAKELRQRLAGRKLQDVLLADIAAGNTVEADGWVIPLSVALLSTLAFSVIDPISEP